MNRVILFFATTIILLFTVQNSNAQTIILSGSGDGGFETGTTFGANGWTVVNSAPVQPNQWFCGTGASAFTGARAAYVGTASTNNNYNPNASSIVHLYRDIVFPVGLVNIKIYFRWRCKGRANEDIMQMFLEPTSTIPVAGVVSGSNQIGNDFRGETSWINDSLDIPCTYAGTTQRLIFTWINDNSQASNTAIAIDNIQIVASSTTNCISSLGVGVTNVASLPYNSGPGTTCGKNDDITDVNATICGDPNYSSDEDVVWIFNPTSSGLLTIDLNAPAAISTGLMIYDGCPMTNCLGIGGTCVSFIQDAGGSKSICLNVIAGHEYYIVLDGDGECNAFDNLFISSVSSSNLGSTCLNPIVISALPYSQLNESTACMGDDYNATTIGSCNSIYTSGEDKVYQYNSSGNECISISLSNLSTPLLGYQVYYGCPGAGGVCIASNGGSSVVVGSITLASAGAYYIIIDSWAPPSAVGYDITIQTFGTGANNDLPCNAELLLNGIYTFGNNNCSSGLNEPSVPLCWSFPGTVNSVWFKSVVGSSGNAFIQTQLLSLVDTQIDAFTGSCGSLVPILNGCNDNGTTGCSGLIASSSLDLTGLNPGDTLYIRVDGVNDLTGTFNIIVSDVHLNAGFNQQDCLGGISVCQSVISEPSSFFGCGMIAEIPPAGNISNPSANVNSGNSGCLLASELNIVWYIVNISSPGLLRWTHTHPAGFYDWIMYDLTNHSCTDIQNNTLPPVRCNWNGAAATMCGMQNPVPGGASPFNFEAPLNVVAGQTIALALSNYSYTNGGFNLDFSASTCGFGSSNAVAWNGSSSNSFSNTANWGGCNSLSCAVDVNIYPSLNQPIINANTSVKSMSILPGSSLTIQPGVTLSICGDFNNYGTLIASPTSTILFGNANVVQHFDGSLVGSNKLGNVLITKTGGSVIANADIEVQGVLKTSNVNSIFDSNNKYIKLGGDLINVAGNTTYINSSPSGTLEFNGSSSQNYFPGGLLDLNNVVINNSGGGVYLPTDDMIIGANGNLNLITGKVITNANKVSVSNTNPLSIVGGSTTSYIEGILQRYVSGAIDSYKFPIGNSVSGFQNAVVDFTTATTIPELTASFSNYTSIANGPVSNDCYNIDYNAMLELDNGYWNIAPTSGTNLADFTLRLYPTNFTSSANYTTILSSSTNPSNAPNWLLNGNCSLLSSSLETMRTNMSEFGYFGIGQGVFSGTLPIELLSFTGKKFSTHNHLEWVTINEVDNDYFTLERSENGNVFKPIAIVDGAGHSTETLKYEVDDKTRKATTNYYRLRQTDFNGTSTISKVIAISSNPNEVAFSLFPNPFDGIINISLNIDLDDEYKVSVYDVEGRLIERQLKWVTTGDTNLQLNLDWLRSGCYFVEVTSSAGTSLGKTKLIKSK